MLSVRHYFATILCIGILSFVNHTASPEGRWSCITRSGQYDEHTWYQLNCSGEIEFQKNGTIISSCSDTFTPTGSKWKISGDTLLLADSDDAVFARYLWKTPDERTLTLEKNGVVFTFDRVFRVQTARN
jgi:hypothetical protein